MSDFPRHKMKVICLYLYNILQRIYCISSQYHWYTRGSEHRHFVPMASLFEHRKLILGAACFQYLCSMIAPDVIEFSHLEI